MALYDMYRRNKGLATTNDAGLLQSYYQRQSGLNPVANSLGNGFQYKDAPLGDPSTGTGAPTGNGIAPPTGGNTLAPPPSTGAPTTGMNPNGGITTPPTGGTARRPNYNSTTGQLDLGEGNQRYGTVGEYLTDPQSNIGRTQGYDPRYYEQYQADIGDSNTETRWRVRPEVRARLNGRVQIAQPGVVGRNADGSPMEGQGFQEVLDPSKVEWDDEFGWVTSPDNISGSDPDDTARWNRIRAAAIAGTLGGAAWAGGLIPGLPGAGTGAGAVADAGLLPALAEPTFPALAGAPTVGSGAAAAGAGAAGSFVPGAGFGMEGAGAGLGAGVGGAIPDTGLLPTLTEPTIPGLATAPSIAGGTGSGFPWSSLLAPIAGLGQGIINRNAGQNTQNSLNNIANQQDPFGPYRSQFANQLSDIYKNPQAFMDFITSNPAYQFNLQQGRQGLERRGASTGYYRSANLDYDLANFTSGLAAQTWDKEIARIMAMAGVNIDPSASANTRTQGVLAGNSMNQSSWNNFFGAVNSLGNNTGFQRWVSSLFPG